MILGTTLSNVKSPKLEGQPYSPGEQFPKGQPTKETMNSETNIDVAPHKASGPISHNPRSTISYTTNTN